MRTKQEQRAALTLGQRRTFASLLLVLALVAAARCGRNAPALDSANELPFGRMDAPVEGAQVLPQTTAGGWALDDKGVREVRLYIDGHYVASVQLNTERPDVRKVYPQYAHDSSLLGWTTLVEFETPGPHALLAQAVDTNGATRDIGSITVVVQGQ